MKASSIGAFFKKYTMVLALVAVAILFSVTTNGKVLYPQNLNNLISQNGYVFTLAAGMLLCILTGGNIDLACGSVVCFAGAIGAVMMSNGINMWLAVIAMLLVGLAVGAFQRYWSAWVRIPPFITTLAGMYAFRGLANVVLQGYAVPVENVAFLNIFGGGADCYIPDFFHNANFNMTCLVAAVIVAVIAVLMTVRKVAVQKKMGIIKSGTADLIKSVIIAAVIIWFGWKLANYKGIPSVLIWIAAVLLIYNYITTKTAVGRHLYAVGGNEKATRLSGVNTNKVFFFAYANMGLLSGLAAILTIARLSSSQPTYGQGYEMDAIAACFIGGASAYGGIGKISGVIIGATLMGLINQGMSIMGMDSNYQKVIKGLVLLLAVMFDVLSKREKK
ncbi:MAG: sugar ABC transporter permease [Clostridia bacterium]|nr:sugar ABC transporter permease [Clostridia bacterium]